SSDVLAGPVAVTAALDVGLLGTTVGIPEEGLAAFRRLAASQRVDAMILHSPTLNDERAALLIELGIPFVLHGRTNIGKPVAWLDIDNTGALERATSPLLDLGHRRIALLHANTGRTFAEHRALGYL